MILLYLFLSFLDIVLIISFFILIIASSAFWISSLIFNEFSSAFTIPKTASMRLSLIFDLDNHSRNVLAVYWLLL